MKSSVKKLFAVTALTAITAVTAISASADGLKTEIISSSGLNAPIISDDGDYITVKLDSDSEVQNETTVLLFKGSDANVSDEDILYINQDKADVAKASGGFLYTNGVLPKERLEKDETYTIRVSDETGVGNFGNGFYEVIFKVVDSGSTPISQYQLGDVTEDGYVDLDDAIELLKYDAALSTLNWDAERLSLGDVTKDSYVDLDDAILLLQLDAGLVSAPTWD